MTDPTQWLSRQPGYWRGCALARKPSVDADVWSDEVLTAYRKIGEYELNAEQCETRKGVV